MELVSFDKIKNNKKFIDDLRWDVTPRIFVAPKSVSGDGAVDLTHGFMLYVDMVMDRPALVIMTLKIMVCKTVGYIYDIPEDLLRDSMQCEAGECIQGMYPLSEKLEKWLKTEFGVTA